MESFERRIQKVLAIKNVSDIIDMFDIWNRTKHIKEFL